MIINNRKILFFIIFYDRLVTFMNKKEVSFDTLYSSYRPLMESMAKKMTEAYSLPESEYDDLVQEASIALFTSASAFDPTRGVTFGLYAKICIKNRLTSYIHSRFVRTLSEADVDLDCLENEESQDITPEQLVIDKESISDMRARIDSALTPLESSVFWLYLIGTPYGDIANALSRPVKSVDNAIGRIKIKLRKLYSES